LLTLGTPCAASEAPPPARLVVSTGAGEADAPLRAWFAEQDRLLDDILVRLARIETLVSELHRLIQRLPVPQPAPAPSMATAAGTGVADAPVPAWAPPLAIGALLLLLALRWLRRRRTPRHVPAATAKPSPPARPAGQPASAVPPPPPVISSTQQDQAIELAEIMLSMGLGHGAAQTLLEQIRMEPKQALRQWLKLLEVYRKNGQQEEFERSAEEMRQHFNVKPEDWHARPDAQPSLEDYPHIAARVTELWGKPACLGYLRNLLADNRGGARAGFPQGVAEELLLLTTLLQARAP
jgi:hypothetical protein